MTSEAAMTRDPREPENKFERLSTAHYEQEIGRLKRSIERLRDELECYRVLLPGMKYVPAMRALFDAGDPDGTLAGWNQEE